MDGIGRKMFRILPLISSKTKDEAEKRQCTHLEMDTVLVLAEVLSLGAMSMVLASAKG